MTFFKALQSITRHVPPSPMGTAMIGADQTGIAAANYLSIKELVALVILSEQSLIFKSQDELSPVPNITSSGPEENVNLYYFLH